MLDGRPGAITGKPPEGFTLLAVDGFRWLPWRFEGEEPNSRI
jgi:hypothetical protein